MGNLPTTQTHPVLPIAVQHVQLVAQTAVIQALAATSENHTFVLPETTRPLPAVGHVIQIRRIHLSMVNAYASLEEHKIQPIQFAKFHIQSNSMIHKNMNKIHTMVPILKLMLRMLIIQNCIDPEACTLMIKVCYFNPQIQILLFLCIVHFRY